MNFSTFLYKVTSVYHYFRAVIQKLYNSLMLGEQKKSYMTICDVLKLKLPDSFPNDEFSSFVNAVRTVTEPKSDSRKEFNGASNLIGWRYRASFEYKESYIESWRKYGANVSFEQIYTREKDFFGMFVCGVSCIESATYACHALASTESILGLVFNVKIRRFKSSPKQLLKKLINRIPDHSLTKNLKAGLESEEWEIFTAFRNSMTHSSNIPRINFGAVGSTPPPERIMQFAETWSTKALSADEEEFDKLFLWLTTFLRNILISGEELANVA